MSLEQFLTSLAKAAKFCSNLCLGIPCLCSWCSYSEPGCIVKLLVKATSESLTTHLLFSSNSTCSAQSYPRQVRSEAATIVYNIEVLVISLNCLNIVLSVSLVEGA